MIIGRVALLGAAGFELICRQTRILSHLDVEERASERNVSYTVPRLLGKQHYFRNRMQQILTHLTGAIAVALFTVPLQTVQAQSSSAPVTIKQQWQPNKRYEHLMTMDSAQTMTMGEQKIEQKVGMTMALHATVTKPKDAGKKLAFKYARVTMDMEMMGQKMAFDSSKPEAATMPPGTADMFKALTTQELIANLDSDDQISSFDNMDAFLKSATAGNPMAEAIGPKQFAESLKQMGLLAFPKGPVKPGDTWPFDQQIDLAQMGKAGVKGTYKFVGTTMHDGVSVAEIAMDGALTVDMNPGAAKKSAAGEEAPPITDLMAALGMKIEGGSYKGTVWFDTALGTTRDMNFVQVMTLTMNNPQNPQERMRIPMNQKVGVKLTKVVDVK